MNCPKCNYANNAEAKFCNQCATSLIQEPMRSVAPLPEMVKVLPKEDWAYKVGMWWAKMDVKTKRICFGAGLFVAVFGFIIVFGNLIVPNQSASNQAASSYYESRSTPPTPSRSTNAPNTAPVKPSGMSSKAHLDTAKVILGGNVTPNDITAAKEHLVLIPDSAPEYKEAKEILNKIKAGKIRPMDEFETKYQYVISDLRNADQALTFEKIKKNPNRYAGETWSFTGKILEIQEPGNATVARIGLGAYGLEAIWVEAPFTTEFVDKNSVFVIGTIKGTKSYTTQAGWEITIPYVEAQAIVKPSDGAKIKAAASR
jgi:hypothetical protein